MFRTAKIPTDTMLAHCAAARMFYVAPKFRGRKANIKAATANLAIALLSSRDPSISPKERLNAAADLVRLSVIFAVRYSGAMMDMDTHEVVLASDARTAGLLGDTAATFRPVRGEAAAVFFLDKRTNRVETWSFRTDSKTGVHFADINIDEQRV